MEHELDGHNNEVDYALQRGPLYCTCMSIISPVSAVMGASFWSVEADVDRSHQFSEGPGSQLQTALPVLRW